MSTASVKITSELQKNRDEYYGRLNAKDAAPLWNVMAKLVTPQPSSVCVAAKWAYAEMRELLLEAGTLITAKEAERRVLVLENPGIRGVSQITQSLYAGLQLIMPGEIAPSHRHTATALRFVIEGEGGYTAVNGERIKMEPGDFIITPSWTFHDHGNEGDSPVIWLDGLDVPIVNLFDTSFAEIFADGDVQPIVAAEWDAFYRYGTNLVPFDFAPTSNASPVFCYPYFSARQTLSRLHDNGPIDACHGIKMQYVNPVTGRYPMPTMSAFLQLMPQGFVSAAYRSTDSTIFCVKEGQGKSEIGDRIIEWTEGDVFVVPSWHRVVHHITKQAILFSFSDKPAQQALGIWRAAKEG